MLNRRGRVEERLGGEMVRFNKSSTKTVDGLFGETGVDGVMAGMEGTALLALGLSMSTIHMVVVRYRTVAKTSTCISLLTNGFVLNCGL